MITVKQLHTSVKVTRQDLGARLKIPRTLRLNSNSKMTAFSCENEAVKCVIFLKILLFSIWCISVLFLLILLVCPTQCEKKKPQVRQWLRVLRTSDVIYCSVHLSYTIKTHLWPVKTTWMLHKLFVNTFHQITA